MDAKKETRHFVRDRCNFNKKKRIKYITIGLVISVLTGFLLYNIAFAGGTNYHHTGAAKINVAGSEMQLRFEYAGGNDKLETDGEYRSLFKNKSRSVYVWADQYSSGGLQVGIEKNGGGHITKKDRIICKTSLDDDKGYSIVTFNISYIQPAHKYILDNFRVWFKNNCPCSYPLYDDFRFEPIKENKEDADDDVRDQLYFGVQCGHPYGSDYMYEIFTGRSGYDIEFKWRGNNSAR